MSTYINVVDGGDDLLSKVKGQQQAGRFAFLEQQRRKELEQETKKQQEQKDQGKKPDPTPFKRELIAHRHKTLTPFCFNWQGTLVGGATQSKTVVVRGVNVPGAGYQQYTAETTYTGGNQLDPDAFKVATHQARLQLPQPVRTSGWSTKIKTNESGVIMTNTYANLWIEDVRNDWRDPWVPIIAAPAVSTAFGPTSFTPSQVILTVDSGVVFITMPVPKSTSAYTTSPYAFNLPVTSYSFYEARGQMINGVNTDVAYLFLKINGASVTQKIVNKPNATALKDFLKQNLYDDDPSKAVRGEGYYGEFRVRGLVAKILRLRVGSGSYLNVPYNFLYSYKASPDALPVVGGGDGFEDHAYALTAWSTPAQLAFQMQRLVPPGSGATQPISISKVNLPPSLFASSRANLQSSSKGYVTPNSYFPIQL